MNEAKKDINETRKHKDEVLVLMFHVLKEIIAIEKDRILR